MGSYLIIESRDPFGSADADYGAATALADHGDDVTVYLVQNGVLATREASTAAGAIGQLAGKVSLLADDFSLRERGITDDEIVDGVSVSSMDALVDLIADDGRKVIWL